MKAENPFEQFNLIKSAVLYFRIFFMFKNDDM